MKRNILFVLCALLVSLTANAQLLWKISGNGLDKPSYVLGTYHLARVNFLDSIPGFKPAFDSCTQMYGEVVLDATDAETAKNNELMASMVIPDGGSLDDLLSKEQMERLNAALRSTLGADLNNPLLSKIKTNKPASLVATLEFLISSKISPVDITNATYDTHLQNIARKAGKNVGGLESIGLQTNILFGAPLKRQAEKLMCLVDNLDYQTNLIKRVIDAYYAQDLKTINDCTEEKLNNSCDSTPEEDNQLIYDRNATWVAEMPALMKDKPTFFAVGAAHLGGERGVLNLLKKAGYTVTEVK